MSLPDASGQAREALYLAASGAASGALVGLSGLVGARLPRWTAAVLDVAAFALASGLCAAALFMSGGEARPAAYLFFFIGLSAAFLPRRLFRRRKEKARRAANTDANDKGG